jgi:hypothetical protein
VSRHVKETLVPRKIFIFKYVLYGTYIATPRVHSQG